MKLNAYIAGVGMTRFGKHLDRGMKSLGGEAIQMALDDAGVDKSAIQAAWMGNAAAGLITGQECISGQVILRGMGIGVIPVINIENACASASTAFEQAAAMVTAGLYDIVLAVGTEKLYHEDKVKTFSAFGSAVDVEALVEIMANLKKGAEASGAKAASDGAGKNRSMFMDIYATSARAHMNAYGTTAEQFAAVSAKNSFHGSLNERAQFRESMSVEEVLAQPMIAEPLTRPMCSPIGDGAAAVVVVSEKKAKELGLVNPVKAVTSVLRSGWDHSKDDKFSGSADLCVHTAYEEAGVGPEDLSLIELHDASAPAEIMTYETLGLCGKGEGGPLVESGATRLGGRIPVNTSGGLLRKGHPIGATGIAQLVELTEQLRGTAGDRQVEGARIGLAHNGGGSIGTDAAAMCVTILKRQD
jgi:acetyl-CoA acetyltransferase